jgi:SHO1 osmosensor
MRCVDTSFSLALCSDSLAIHRFQLAVVLAVAEVFAVYGAEFIFSDRGSLIAVGVGWLLLAMVDVSAQDFCVV